jgi:ribosomal protein L44E
MDKSIALVYTCTKCQDALSNASHLIHHYKTIHQIHLPARKPCIVRPRERNMTFQRHRGCLGYDMEHYACPSCWFHCNVDSEGFDSLVDHVKRHIKRENHSFRTANDMAETRNNKSTIAIAKTRQGGKQGSNNDGDDDEKYVSVDINEMSNKLKGLVRMVKYCMKV